MSGTIAFVQGHGSRDLFTSVPPTSLFGWRRNVGLLVSLLEAAGVAWRDIHAPTLDGLTVAADLVILRDARYRPAEVEAFRRRHPGLPVLAMVFQAPRPIVERQCAGEARALFSADLPVAEPRESATGVFAADRVVVRTRANAEWYRAMGYPRERMVLLPHAPLWCRQDAGVCAADLPAGAAALPRPYTLLFVGDNLLRKGFFRLYRALRRLPAAHRRLLVCNRALSRLRQGDPGELPPFALAEAREVVADATVEIRDEYRTLDDLGALAAECDVLASPSVLDVGPNTLVEAWQLGLGIIASDACGGLDDLPLVPTVAAPVWWREPGKGADDFTERLAAALHHAHRDPPQVAMPGRHEVSAKLQDIVRIWRELLPGFLA
jgi:glycosyltransferase involved in cell wall biosynthesis